MESPLGLLHERVYIPTKSWRALVALSVLASNVASTASILLSRLGALGPNAASK
jgi:hypothetical protein